MFVTYRLKRNEICIMDEFQFIESLDALLANEAIDETTTAAVELANTSITPVPGHGMLAAPMGQLTGTTSSNTNWFTGNDTTLSRSDPFAMPLHSNQGLTAERTTPTIEPAPYSQYTNAYMDQQQAQKPVGPILHSASPVAPITSPIQRPNVTTAASVAPSVAASVCSANSRGSSNASSSRRKGGSKSNNSITSAGSAASHGTKMTKAGSRKRTRGGTSMAVSDSEDDSTRRRHDRNLREQRRSQKITHQIDQLRDILAAASVRFKPDKYSTLVSVVEYVKQLQRRSTMLDSEHKKLLDTITKANEIVNEPYVGNSSASASATGIDPSKPDVTLSNGVGDSNNGAVAGGSVAGGAGDIYNDDELFFVRNVNYKCIFERCGMPLAVASIDGRLLDCNHEFVKLTGYRREELLPNEQLQQQGSSIVDDDTFSPNSIFPDAPSSSNSNAMANKSNGTVTNSKNAEIRNFSLFNLLSRNNMEEVFVSLSEMLKQPPQDENGTNSVLNSDYWSGNVRLSRNTHLEVSYGSFGFGAFLGDSSTLLRRSQILTLDVFWFDSPISFLYSDADKRIASEKSSRSSQVFRLFSNSTHTF